MATDYLLVIDGIKGESGDDKLSGAIEVLSWGMGASNSGSMASAGGGGVGKVQFKDFQFSAWTSTASPPLHTACASGQHFKKATFYGRKQGGQQEVYLTVTMTGVLVASFKIGDDPQSAQAQLFDVVTLNFAQIEIEYRPQKADGTLGPAIKGGYNLKQNKKL